MSFARWPILAFVSDQLTELSRLVVYCEAKLLIKRSAFSALPPESKYSPALQGETRQKASLSADQSFTAPT